MTPKSWIVMSSGRNFAPYLCVRCVLRTKSDGKNRNVSAFQWTPPPPTPVMGMNAPQSRIGSACSLILLRKVNVSCSGRRKSSWRMRYRSSSWSKVVGKSVGASRHGPRSIATTSRPSSVNSFARIEPVQPSPMIATSFLGSLRAILFALQVLRAFQSARPSRLTGGRG